MKRLALPGSRREGRSGPQPGRAGVQPAAGPPARPQPEQRPQLLPGRPVRPSAAFSGKPSSLPRRPFLLHRRDPRERRGSESPTAAPLRPPHRQRSGAGTGGRSYPGAPVTSWHRLRLPSLRLAQPEGHNYRLGNYLCLYKQGRRPLGSASRATPRQLLTPGTEPKDKAGRARLQTSGSLAPKLKLRQHLHTHLHSASLNTGPSDRRDRVQNFYGGGGAGGAPSAALVTEKKKKKKEKNKRLSPSLPPPPPQPAYLWQSPVYLVQVSRHPNAFPYCWSGKSPASNAPGHSTSAFFF